jgi:hypothetical protein|tara:strand:+ start:323 stop:493 length:171 start_codon:yes stop_codon:yes gene_type:complete
MKETKDGKYNGIYKSPIDVPVPSTSGYPNNVPNTQTVKTRGTGAATKGTNSSTRLA